jgi:cytochrome o ubiquinol oxidase subunit 3
MSEMSIQHAHGDAKASAQTTDNQKFAMWLYLASEVVIFTVFIAGYALFRFREAEAVKELHQELGLGLVSFNTFLLLMSSWAMVMGLMNGRRGNRQGLIRWIALTALLGTTFVALQYVEYRELASLGIALNNPEVFEGFGMRF